jgi:hypothetical protein
VGERVSTVLFLFPNSREIRHMRDPPRLGSRVRSRRRATYTVAEVIDWGSDTYTAICVGTASASATVPERAAGQESAVRERHRYDKDLAADLLQRTRDSLLLKRAKDSLSPRAIRRRWRDRNYLP